MKNKKFIKIVLILISFAIIIVILYCFIINNKTNEDDKYVSELNIYEDFDSEVVPEGLNNEEYNSLKVLIKGLASINRLNEGEAWYVAPIEFTDYEIWAFLGYICQDNYEENKWSNDRYLPSKLSYENNLTTYEMESINAYTKQVFGKEIDIQNICSFFEESNGLVIKEDPNYVVDMQLKIDGITRDGEELCINGIVVLSLGRDIVYTEVVYQQPRVFNLKLKKNNNSPFGYTCEAMDFQLVE